MRPTISSQTYVCLSCFLKTSRYSALKGTARKRLFSGKSHVVRASTLSRIQRVTPDHLRRDNGVLLSAATFHNSSRLNIPKQKKKKPKTVKIVDIVAEGEGTSTNSNPARPDDKSAQLPQNRAQASASKPANKDSNKDENRAQRLRLAYEKALQKQQILQSIVEKAQRSKASHEKSLAEARSRFEARSASNKANTDLPVVVRKIQGTRESEEPSKENPNKAGERRRRDNDDDDQKVVPAVDPFLPREKASPLAYHPDTTPDAQETGLIDGALIPFKAVETHDIPEVPRLSFDLSRVLFNPGVYHLQDPRSRVFNFDPYLQDIMPVSEFNLDVLNPYITSSKDTNLRSVSLRHSKRYIGSSSSMSGAMSHFHFLLSAWRPIDPSILSQKITGLNNFTVITRAPSSIYLRWRNGVYAIDADKQYDKPNILMMQGKSMEKLLTLEKEDFEKYRKPKAGEKAPAVEAGPEAYHYSTVANFLLRSQLDAYDPRLPGTGMFDLKTRAVAGIRFNLQDHEVGMGYQIRERTGLWESYDREYFDMIRSAFLKYSLQVRMGRMDGIFVAYHNIARIFGFQYISLPEMDMALHGTSDPTIGDREYRMTLKLMNDLFDLATKELPDQSLRFVFETREPTKTAPTGEMRMFAVPMTEDEIDKVQAGAQERIDTYEKLASSGASLRKQTIDNVDGAQPDGQNFEGVTFEQKVSTSTLESSAPDEVFLDQILGPRRATTPSEELTADGKVADEAPKTVIGWTLNIRNVINGDAVERPDKINSSDRWEVQYVFARIEDDKVKKLYQSTMQRKKEAFTDGLESKKDNFFVNNIIRLSEQGKAWREEQDALDSQRQQVVLYKPGSS